MFGGDWKGYHGLRPGVPYTDPTPDYVVISASESNGYTNLQFERETTTEEDDDPHDVQYRVRNIQRADSIKVALGIGNWALARIACVASVSNRVIARKSERKQKKG